jgi:hypothetical protein
MQTAIATAFILIVHASWRNFQLNNLAVLYIKTDHDFHTRISRISLLPTSLTLLTRTFPENFKNNLASPAISRNLTHAN